MKLFRAAGNSLIIPGVTGGGGYGRGSNSVSDNGFAGTANTGGGGGGGTGLSGAGGAGGSGIVIIKFPDTYSLSVGAGLTSTNATSGGFKTYTFTAGTGTVTFS
jgi:hypothetical protein